LIISEKKAFIIKRKFQKHLVPQNNDGLALVIDIAQYLFQEYRIRIGEMQKYKIITVTDKSLDLNCVVWFVFC
jgi:hypothetical protein